MCEGSFRGFSDTRNMMALSECLLNFVVLFHEEDLLVRVVLVKLCV